MSDFQEHPVDNMAWEDHVVKNVWKNNSPICLIAFEDQQGNITKSRLDLQKKIFIDYIPVVSEDGKINTLVELVKILPS